MFLIVLLSVILVKYHIYNMKVTGKEIFLMKNGQQIKFNTIFNDIKRVYHIEDLKKLYEFHPISQSELV